MSQRPDEEEEPQPRGRPNAYFADHEIDTYGGSFRGTRPAPHGGSTSVSPDDTYGSLDLCWCGLPFDHDWPGKAGGARHPREGKNKMNAPEEPTRIDRRQLRAYHSDIADVILTAVNEYGARHRTTHNSVILFPPDGSQPYTVNARNGDRQVRNARTWFVRHCIPKGESIEKIKKRASKVVDDNMLKELADTMNSEEHLRPEEAVADPVLEKAEAAGMAAVEKAAQEAAAEVMAEPVEEPPATEGEWVPYRVNLGKRDERVHEFYVMRGEEVKCTIDGWIGTKRGAGGHTRTHHTDTTDLWGPEAKRKAVETHFAKKIKGDVEAAIKLLQAAIGTNPEQDLESLLEENLQLKAQVVELEGQVAELQARIDLAREAFKV